MITVELEVLKRESLGKEANKKYRDQGLVPAVVYGKNKENLNILVDPKVLKKLIKLSALAVASNVPGSRSSSNMETYFFDALSNIVSDRSSSSLSASRGSVLCVFTSSPSIRPSLSLSARFGFVPKLNSV